MTIDQLMVEKRLRFQEGSKILLKILGEFFWMFDIYFVDAYDFQVFKCCLVCFFERLVGYGQNIVSFIDSSFVAECFLALLFCEGFQSCNWRHFKKVKTSGHSNY
eukprot:TRINITY_DN7387_c0_g1_i2.p1 TRINITY_DN7387_c0_g1~~TRINITY_DN7387_c0_g1_i2.p1  ORF type:complete len:105 (-),score=9.41 TRINITY_DN7387_c0_g1_i2:26-340(-)